MATLNSVLPVYHYSNLDFDDPLEWVNRNDQIQIIETADIDL